MPAIPKKLLRTLPTLTEVVTPPVLSDAVSEGARTPTALDSEAIIERVMQRLDVSLEDRVRQVVDTIVQEHIREIEPRLKQKVGVAVRAAVSKAVTAEVKEQQAKQK
jgi:hypothetical protein